MGADIPGGHRGLPPPRGGSGGMDIVPASGTGFFAFLHSNGPRFLGRPFVGDEYKPVKDRLIATNPGLNSAVVTSLAHDILHISAFILAHQRLMHVAPEEFSPTGEVSPTLVSDINHSIWNKRDPLDPDSLSPELLRKLVAFTDVFESRKEEVRRTKITFTRDDRRNLAIQAIDMARAAKRQLNLPPKTTVYVSDAVEAAFRGIDEGFNDYGDMSGAIPTPPFHPDGGSSSGKTANIPPSGGGDSAGAEVDEGELVGAGPGRRGR